MLQTIRNLTPTQWIILGISTAGFLNASTAQLTEWFGPKVAHDIISGLGFAQGLIGCWVMALSGQGSIVKQVLAMPGVQHIEVNADASATLAQIAVDKNVDKIAPAPAVQAKVEQIARVGVLLAAFVLSFLVVPHGAMAQGIKLPLKPSVARSQAAVSVPAATTTDPLQQLITQLQSVQQDIVTGTITDLNDADADAATLTNASDPTSFRDPIAHACYPAAVKFLQSLPVATPTQGKYVLVQLFQKKRDFVAQIQAGLPLYLKMGCAPLLGDEVTIFMRLMGLVGIKIGAAALTGLFPASAPLTLPALTLP